MAKEETRYLLIEKLKNMIHSFPDYATSLNVESVTNALRWLYGTVECEDLPVATEIFRSCYSEIIKMILEDERAVIECNCVGDFLMKCYQKFSECMGIFWFGVDSLANVNSNIEDPLSEEMVATVYKGNIIKNLIMDCQSYTKYRPNETTGGIFVSWRRKEELPTGA